MTHHPHSPARRAADLLSHNTYLIPSNANRLRQAFEHIAKNKAVRSGNAADAKLYDKLVEKGLVTKDGEGFGAPYSLSPAQQESYDWFLQHYQAEEDAAEAEEAAAEAAALAVQRWAVLLVHLDNAYTETLCIVGGAEAERHTHRRAAECNTPGIKAIAVRLADAERLL